MNKFFLSILLLLSLHEAFAQSGIDSLSNHNDYILNAVEYKKGIYKTFEEFKFNNPSISNIFLFDGKRLWLTDSSSGKNQKVKKREVYLFAETNTTNFLQKVAIATFLRKALELSLSFHISHQ